MKISRDIPLISRKETLSRQLVEEKMPHFSGFQLDPILLENHRYRILKKEYCVQICSPASLLKMN